jgi:hypothetical protein
VRAFTEVAEDLDRPAACYVLKARVSGDGWSDLELKVVDYRFWSHPLLLTHGRRFHGVISAVPRQLEIPLSTLGLFWPRDLDDGDEPFRLSGIEFVQTGPTAGASPDRDLRLHLTDLRLVDGDCVEGSPPHFRFERVAVDGEARSYPVIQNAQWAGRLALRVDFSLPSNNHWQRIIAHDRWQWSCADTLELHFAAAQPTQIQLVLEDAQKGATGARWYADMLLDGGSTWKTERISVRNLKPFDSTDSRLLDWTRIRQVAIAIIRGSVTPQSGTVYLDKLEASARPEALRSDGTCLRP